MIFRVIGSQPFIVTLRACGPNLWLIRWRPEAPAFHWCTGVQSTYTEATWKNDRSSFAPHTRSYMHSHVHSHVHDYMHSHVLSYQFFDIIFLAPFFIYFNLTLRAVWTERRFRKNLFFVRISCHGWFCTRKSQQIRDS